MLESYPKSHSQQELKQQSYPVSRNIVLLSMTWSFPLFCFVEASRRVHGGGGASIFGRGLELKRPRKRQNWMRQSGWQEASCLRLAGGSRISTEVTLVSLVDSIGKEKSKICRADVHLWYKEGTLGRLATCIRSQDPREAWWRTATGKGGDPIWTTKQRNWMDRD